MAKYRPEGADLDAVFHALTDATRRAMVERLVAGPASVSQLAEPFDSALPTIVKHLRVLEDAGIVESQKAGRVRTYQLVADALVGANNWIVRQRRPQERQLDRLGDYLVADTKQSTHKPRRRNR
jgi:DNA-binding transcriptional ArsR family regulator